MQVEQFHSGHWLQQYQYKSFSPTPINCEWQWLDPQERASRALAELNALSLMVPDVGLFIRIHIAKEANTSSRIEGTQTQMDEALMRRVQVPDLIRIALSHYQFETLHPFLDGNGRIGRLLITLYRVDKGLLHKPALYLSDFFERNRGAYYDALTVVRSSNDLLHWLRFFLTAVVESATSSKNTFMAVMALRQEVEHQIFMLGKRGENAKRLLLHLYKRPMLSIGEAAEVLGLTHQSASALVRQLEGLNILVETTGYGRNRLYLFKRYFDLFVA